MTKKSPYKVHGFVCTNNRRGVRRSCADGDAVEVRAQLKEKIKNNGWWGKQVRISSSGCLGLCQQGPNVVLYPSGRVFCETSLDDVDQIIEEISEILDSKDSS